MITMRMRMKVISYHAVYNLVKIRMMTTTQRHTPHHQTIIMQDILFCS